MIRNATALVASTLAAAIALGASAVQAFDPQQMSDDERTAFNAAVRDYLLSSPEVLMEAIAILENREQSAQLEADRSMVAAVRPVVESAEYAWVGGNPEGDITVVEFFDYRCGYCKRAYPELEQLVTADGNIRVVYREFPILGDASVLASRFAVATQIALGDDAYKLLHDALMQFDGQIDERALVELAQALDLDTAAIMATVPTGAVTDVISANRELAQALRITGTPTLLIGGEMVRGYLPLQQMESVVSSTREAG